MSRIVEESAWVEIDQFVAAFERAWSAGQIPEIAEFAPPSHHPHYQQVLVELLRVDMEYRYESGRARPFPEYLHAYAESLDDVIARSLVAFEEYRLRLRAGEAVTREEYSERFGCHTQDWPQIESAASDGRPLSTIVENRLSALTEKVSAASNDFPSIGERVAGFELIGELGRGAFSRVFLARQGDLADRYVALKLAEEGPGESDKLAQLQHSHIVPIYSAHRWGRFSVVCMPYFGSATIDDLLRAVRSSQQLPKSAELIENIATRTIADAPSDVVRAGDGSLSAATPSLRSYVDGVLTLAAETAEGLAHAHRRGILHRDLKPANVLLANDGRAMILDFNLSHDTKPNARRDDLIGGTLPYMAPEQLQAYCDHRNCQEPRSDVFSLGVMMYELLTGLHPFPSRRQAGAAPLAAGRLEVPASMRMLNRHVTPAVEAMVDRCLNEDPRRRYATAAELGEDLRRHLASLPLRHIANPSWVERARKWVKRHPRLTSASSVTFFAVVLLAATGASLATHAARLADFEAAARIENFQEDLQSLRVGSLTAVGPDRDGSDDVLQRCRGVLEPYAVLSDAYWCDSAAVQRLSLADRSRLAADVGEVLYLMAAITRGRAVAADQLQGRRQLLQDAKYLNRRASSCYPAAAPPHAVGYLDRLLSADLEDRDEPTFATDKVDFASTRDVGMQACLLSLERRFREALPLWREVTRQDPQNLWSQFGQGYCHEQVGEYSYASACYTACVALNPRFADGYQHRGMMWLKQKEFARAREDFDAALALEPERTDALRNRALAHLGDRRYAEAVADLEAVMNATGEEPRTLLMMAYALENQGERDAARGCRLLALTKDPADADSWVARGASRAASNPAASLADFDRALALHPTSLAALESKAHVLSEQLGRTDDAVAVLKRAVRLHPEQASTIAARGVLLARNGLAEAARTDAERALQLDDSDAVRYQVAGIFALLSPSSTADCKRALHLLAGALHHGYGIDLIAGDPDLISLRDDPDFKRLTAAARTLQAAARHDEHTITTSPP